jgi:transposase
MTKRVRVRRLSDAEGRQLQQIVRRGGKTDRSIVKWRRAMVVLASAGGNDVAAIARLVQTSPDRVREMIHRFNDLGMRSLDPQWAGSRPRQITTTDRALIVKTATTRPSWVARSRTGRSASSPTIWRPDAAAR